MNTASLENQLKQAQLRLAELEQIVAKERQETDRLQAELRRSIDRFRELVDHLRQVFWIFDIQTRRVLYVSPAYETIWGRTCESLYQDPRAWLDAIHPEDRSRVTQVFDNSLDKGAYEEEYRIVRPNGVIRWVWDRGYAVRDERNNLQHFVGIAEDITQRKQTELQNARLAAIIEYAEDAIVSLTLDGVVISWNPGAERLYGYAAEEIIGHPIFTLYPPEKYDEYRTVMERVRRGEPLLAFETVRRRKDGTLVEVAVSAAPIAVRSQVAGVSEIDHDISRIKQLERQVEQGQRMEALGTLAAGVAHDFNNLLTIINGHSELLVSRLHPEDPMRESLAEIHKAGVQARMLSRQLLAFGRREVLEPKVLDLSAVVTDTERMLRSLIGTNVVLTTVLDAALQPIKVDPGQLQRVLMNLVTNARDAMPQGGRLTIETRNVTLDNVYVQTHPDLQPGAYVMLAVSDTGTGIDEATKPRIFEPFVTTKPPGAGMGLGLAVVYGIVKQSGGHIEVDSTVGRGTTFKVYFPQVQEALASVQAFPGSPTIPTGSKTVLLVEDEDSVRTLCRHILQSCGYTVLEARDGPEAIRVAQSHDGPIHLVVSDVVIPHLGGRQLVDRLKELRPGLKVLFLSDYADDTAAWHGLLGSDVALLQKPFTLTTLAQKVWDVLNDGAAPSLPARNMESVA